MGLIAAQEAGARAHRDRAAALGGKGMHLPMGLPGDAVCLALLGIDIRVLLIIGVRLCLLLAARPAATAAAPSGARARNGPGLPKTAPLPDQQAQPEEALTQDMAAAAARPPTLQPVDIHLHVPADGGNPHGVQDPRVLAGSVPTHMQDV